ncbi:hypothetical protein KIW84_054987 [Lathyrus oleraceus]|uniref:Uncharacterized protein n=1 Tax=Pisum sativum TaxID=3888 RepID=A0A9D5AKT3_PEA|nr:hypothetical protein KIW84_054987 [Pisum sativum]
MPAVSSSPIHHINSTPSPSLSSTPPVNSTVDSISSHCPLNPLATPDLSSSHTTPSFTSNISLVLILSNLDEASTISPTSSPDTTSTSRHVSVPLNPSQYLINPLNVHAMETRAKSGITQPILNPTLLLTNIKPILVGHALAALHWFKSMKEEYQALLNNQTWTLSLLKELRCKFQTPKILCDNLSTDTLTHNPILHNKIKHMELDIFFVREKVFNLSLIVAHVPAQDKWTDALTKPLSAVKFLPLRDKLRVFNKQSLIHTPFTLKGNDRVMY